MERVPPRTVGPWHVSHLERAEAASRRSKDPHTQHGAVVVGRGNIPVGDGYNGPPAGVDDDLIHWGRDPLPDDPYGLTKYDLVIHAEANAINRARENRGHFGLSDCTIYVTGMPCPECAKQIVDAKIRRVVVGDRASASVDAKKTLKTIGVFRLYGVSVHQATGDSLVPYDP